MCIFYFFKQASNTAEVNILSLKELHNATSQSSCTVKMERRGKGVLKVVTASTATCPFRVAEVSSIPHENTFAPTNPPSCASEIIWSP